MDDLIENALSVLIENVREKISDTVCETIKNTWQKFIDGFNQTQANIETIELDVINKAKLVEIASINKVDGCTEVAVYKTITDESYLLYLAYSKDKELLDKQANKFVIIKSKSIAPDVDMIFKNDQLVLLK